MLNVHITTVSFHFSGGDGKYTEIDQLVLNYIGIESAVLEGLPVAESNVQSLIRCSPEASTSFLSMLEDDADDCEPHGSQEQQSYSVPEKKIPEPSKTDAAGKTARKRRDLLIEENLELQNKKLHLEILLLEHDCKTRGIPIDL